MTDQRISVPAGMVVVTTFGMITGETVTCLLAMQGFNERNGISGVSYDIVNGTLVDKARNDAVRLLLSRPESQWLLFADGDMTWEASALQRILATAYGTHPDAAVVGGYCNLRGELALPTIDSGTGTWESWMPYSGVVDVMRTGAAFLLVKRHVFERLPQPWFALRVPKRPIDAYAEVDNHLRTKFDGQNPFRDKCPEEWDKAVAIAQSDPSSAPENFTPAEVGEDSGFLDRCRLAGLRCVVDTNIVTGHVDRKVITYRDHQKAMTEIETQTRLCVGLLA
jgi:hypothetical protein